jgi:hypothetical protein
MAFVAIQDGNTQPALIRQGFVTLQPVVHVMDAAPQTLGIHQGGHAPNAVGAAHGLPMRVQNKTVTLLTTREAGIRGWRRRSTTPATTVWESWKIFSA